MSTKEKEDDLKDLQKKIRFSTIIAIIIVTTVFSSYIGYLGIYKDLQISNDSGSWGTFGDFIGGLLNPIIAGLAFYWLTQSVLIQKKELSETQNVLKETEKTQKKQRFENSFFSLLEQMNAVFSQLNTSDKESTNNISTLTFKNSSSKLSRLYNKVHKKSPRIEMMFLEFRKNSSDINHYFRIIYQILKFIFTNNYNSDFKDSLDNVRDATPTEKFYSNIVRSFLNHEITLLLAINCINLKDSQHTFESCDDIDTDYIYFDDFKKLIEHYSLLEHIENILDIPNIIDFYEKKAFGKNPNALKLYAEKERKLLCNLSDPLR